MNCRTLYGKNVTEGSATTTASNWRQDTSEDEWKHCGKGNDQSHSSDSGGSSHHYKTSVRAPEAAEPAHDQTHSESGHGGGEKAQIPTNQEGKGTGRKSEGDPGGKP